MKHSTRRTLKVAKLFDMYPSICWSLGVRGFCSRHASLNRTELQPAAPVAAARRWMPVAAGWREQLKWLLVLLSTKRCPVRYREQQG